jgi:hypothetical protein
MFRIVSILCMSLILQSCVGIPFPQTTSLKTPIDRTTIPSDYFSSIDLRKKTPSLASIGDELFVMNRFSTSNREVVTAIPPTTDKFPYDSIWTGTHKYDDGTSEELIVYTTPTYYDGGIGVILDKYGQLATGYPLVQVEGSKAGRRWRLNATGKFFSRPSDNPVSWALRYGGQQ